MKLRIAFILVCFAFAPYLNAATYYVSFGGSNSNTGAINSPFLTIQQGVNQMIAGDSLLIFPGVYPEAVWLNGNQLNAATDTLDFMHIIGIGQVTMQGSDTLSSAFGTYFSSFIHIENITMENYSQHGMNFNGAINIQNNGFPLQQIRLINITGLGIGNLYWKHGIRINNTEHF